MSYTHVLRALLAVAGSCLASILAVCAASDSAAGGDTSSGAATGGSDDEFSKIPDNFDYNTSPRSEQSTVLCTYKQPIKEDSGIFLQRIAWSPDGSLVATSKALSGDANDNPAGERIEDTVIVDSNNVSVLLWEPYTGIVRAILDVGSHPCHAMAWSPDSKKLITGHTDGAVRVWNTSTINEVPNTPTAPISLSPTAPISLSPTASTPTLKAERTAFFSSIKYPADATRSSAHAAIRVLAWSFDNNIFVGNVYKEAYIRSLANLDSEDLGNQSFSEITSNIVFDPDQLSPVRWSPDGRYIAATGDDPDAKDYVGMVQVWDTQNMDKQPYRKYKMEEVNPGPVSWNKDGTRLIAVHGAFIRIIDTSNETVKPEKTAPGVFAFLDGKQVTDAAWSPDGTLFASIKWGGNTSVQVWNPATSKPGLYTAPPQDVDASADGVFAWSPDSKYIMYCVPSGIYLFSAKLAITSPSDVEPPPSQLFGNLTSDGIWFVIQNRADLETDFGVPAKGNALAWDASNPTPYMTTIPLDGDYDKFLWQYDLVTHRLTNKGTNTSLEWIIFSGENSVVGNASINSTTVELYGSNSFLIKTTQVQGKTSNFLTYKDNTLSTNEPERDRSDKNFAQQVWIAQPMEVVSGYEIAAPSSQEGVSPFTKKIDEGNGVSIYGTATTSNWAMLNSSLIVWNMLQSMINQSMINRVLFSCSVMVISDSDVHDGIPQSWIAPENFTSDDLQFCLHNETTKLFTSKLFSLQKSQIGPDRYAIIICESSMLPGPGSPTPSYLLKFNQPNLLDFCQLKSEFSMAIGAVIIPKNGDASKDQAALEDFEHQSTSWFLVRSRSAFDEQTLNKLENIFNKSNTWLPPRRLRNDPR